MDIYIHLFTLFTGMERMFTVKDGSCEVKGSREGSRGIVRVASGGAHRDICLLHS